MKNKLAVLLKKWGASGLLLAVLTGCTPGDISYCEGMGITPGHPEYPSCIQYYRQQSALFGGDYSRCSMQADMSYPPTLYDNGKEIIVGTHVSKHGITTTDSIEIPPDAQHNAQIDMLRSRIIQPCMDAQGWNSANSWMAGRHPVAAPRSVPSMMMSPINPPAAPLPWQR